MARQLLTLVLDGITAADDLAWLRDAEPPALGSALRAIGVRADPLGDAIELELSWLGEPPTPRAAAAAAGFALTPDVVAVAPSARALPRAA